MQLGDKVTYIRQGKDGVLEGAAILKGMGMDGEGRTIALLKEGEDSFNTFLQCLNRDKAFHKEFKSRVAEIDRLSKEGNAAAKAVVDDYNARVGAVYDALIGKPLEI